MSEIKLQSDITREISVRYPDLRGQFFHVSNERKSQNQAFQARSIGIFPGVSDFLFFNWNEEKRGIDLIGIEVKEPGSFHKKDHIQQQYEWGCILEENGGKYFIVTTVKQCVDIINREYENILQLNDIKKMLDECKTKSIKF